MSHNVLSELFSSVLLVLGGVVLFLKELLCVPMCVSLYLHVFLMLFVRLFCFILLFFFLEVGRNWKGLWKQKRIIRIYCMKKLIFSKRRIRIYITENVEK